MEKRLIPIIFSLWVLEMIVLAAVSLIGTPSKTGFAAAEIQSGPEEVRAYLLPTRTTQPSPYPTQLPPTYTPTFTPQPTATPTPSPTPTATNTPQPGRPIRVQIPALDIDTIIERVGLTDNGEMAAPSAWDTVGWFELGYRPGQIGNAVLTGHLDTNTGAAAIFWSLSDLASGDLIHIETETGETLTFQVETVTDYPYDKAPLDDIFGPADTPNLNLITCHGNWDRQAKIYDHRLVVYAHRYKESE